MMRLLFILVVLALLAWWVWWWMRWRAGERSGAALSEAHPAEEIYQSGMACRQGGKHRLEIARDASAASQVSSVDRYAHRRSR